MSDKPASDSSPDRAAILAALDAVRDPRSGQGLTAAGLVRGLTIRGARAIRVIATGARKATAVRALVRGPENPDWPCSFLHAHADIEVFMDAPAAAAL